MVSIPVNMEENLGTGEGPTNGHFVRVIVADTQAIFRAGLRKIFALEDDIRVVGQAETLAQTQSAVAKFSADVLIFEAALSPNPVDAVGDILRQNPELKVVVVTPGSDEGLTLELFRRGAHGIVSREVEPELLVDCLRKVAAGETWLDSQGVHWVMEAYRNQNSRAVGTRPKVQLTPKESMIVSCVTQGMKNKEIAVRVGTTEQVVKNYLRKVYDKLGVADRLELALYCLNHRVVDNVKPPAVPANGNAASAAAGAGVAAVSSAAASTGAKDSTSSTGSGLPSDSPLKIS
ncbi:MAG TPA: response regulator transcription factor [Verrucomicrobiae bacterium]|jgi:two-component system, NarL family, nitrate/nitrite response regulator NarL|nr:response regulator transcription factor [Verrucomicrobiae bacterium]